MAAACRACRRLQVLPSVVTRVGAGGLRCADRRVATTVLMPLATVGPRGFCLLARSTARRSHSAHLHRLASIRDLVGTGAVRVWQAGGRGWCRTAGETFTAAAVTAAGMATASVLAVCVQLNSLQTSTACRPEKRLVATPLA